MTRLLKIFIFTFAFSLLAFAYPSPAKASQFIDAMTAPGMNLQKYIIGEDAINPNGTQGMLTTLTDGITTMALGAKDKDGNIISRGATGTLFAFMGVMQQNPVVSSKQYLAYLQKNIGLTPKVYAAGGGADFLKPVLNLWIVTRNVVYLFFIVIFVAIGFMIMFRSKLNPQTTVNIQLALPGIIVSLILVTFSFAICGLIVDLAYLGNKLVYNIFYDKFVIGPLADPTWNPDATPFKMIQAANIGAKLNTALAAIVQVMAGGGAAALFNVIIAMTIVSTAFKIFFTMLTKYISLFIITLLSPFAFLLSAFPGGGGNSLNTFKQILSAALVFPAITFMTNLAYYFSAYAETASTDFKDLEPFLLTDFVSIAQTGGGILEGDKIAIATISGLIALGVLMAAAQIPQVIDGALGVKPTLGAGTGEEIGGALRKIPIIGGMIS